jgi:hypothetical protein
MSRVDDHIRPLTNVKMYGADTGPERWFRADVDGVERFWRNIFAAVLAQHLCRNIVCEVSPSTCGAGAD